MLDCHAVGENKLLSYFTSHMMHKPCLNTLVRQEKLQTMGKFRKRRKTRTPKPNQLIVLALKAQLLQAQKLNSAPEIHEQFYLLPKALVHDNGLPRKGQKISSRTVLVARYPGVITSTLPSHVLGDKQNTVVVLDGMFLLQSYPLAHHSLLADYVYFLLCRWILPQFTVANNVHFVWDDPGRHGPSAKDVERHRHDGSTTCSKTVEVPCTLHKPLQLSSKCPSKEMWSTIVCCRTCKRSLVQLITCGSLLLMQIQGMQPGQKFATAGGFHDKMRDRPAAAGSK